MGSSSERGYRCRRGVLGAFADGPRRGQERAAPNAAAKRAFRLAMGVTMALPAETVPSRLSGIMKRENESVEMTHF